jgi:hypothetical protein
MTKVRLTKCTVLLVEVSLTVRLEVYMLYIRLEVMPIVCVLQNTPES